MSTGLTLGLIAALCWGSTDVSAAVAGRRLGGLRVAAILQLTSLLAVLVLCVARNSWLPARIEDTLAAAFFGIVAAGAYISVFTALRIGPVSVVSPVVAAYGGFAVVLALILRGETLTPLQGLGAVLATGGVILTGLVFDGGWRGTRIVGRGVLFAMVAMTCFACLTVGLAGPIRSAGWLPVLLADRASNAATVWIVLALVLAFRPARAAALLAGSTERSGGRWRIAILAACLGGLLDIGGFVAFVIGLEQAPTWLIGLSSSFGPVVAIFVAVLVWGERLRPTQWLGLAGIVMGLVAVALP